MDESVKKRIENCSHFDIVHGPFATHRSKLFRFQPSPISRRHLGQIPTGPSVKVARTEHDAVVAEAAPVLQQASVATIELGSKHHMARDQPSYLCEDRSH